MNSNDPDAEALHTSGTFILGTSLAGWTAGMAVCVTILMLAAAPTSVTVLFSLGALVSALILSAWLARRIRNGRRPHTHR